MCLTVLYCKHSILILFNYFSFDYINLHCLFFIKYKSKFVPFFYLTVSGPMSEDLQKRIKQLEDELSVLKNIGESKVKSLETENSVNSKSQEACSTTNSLESDEDLLFYLKSILGYSVKHYKNTIIIRSVYSFASEDIFELEVSNNKLVLKNTDYLLEWEDFFNVYIKNGRSYCAFFAAVTLELYNRRTFG